VRPPPGAADVRPESADVALALAPATCPACGHHVAVPLFDGGHQPLATLGWPATAAQARTMPRYLLRFVRCVECGHVFNAAFDYRVVPYTDQPNRMFNQGAGWTAHLARIQEAIRARVPANPVVVEIGHGSGRFLGGLAASGPPGRYIGFDPHGVSRSTGGAVEFRQALFEPACHVHELRPDLIISRHVLEHLANPLGFVQSLAFAAAAARLETRLYLEVPCIDRALATGRWADFYYEHNSHFTTGSFTTMLARGGTEAERIALAYDGEVIYAFARIGRRPAQLRRAAEALTFREAARQSIETIRRQLADLVAAGRTVAVWGGTGKGAAFIAQLGMDATRFPIVVDSDPDKAGTFVPGTGQEIRHRDWLLTHPVDVIIVPTRWRARDIVAEMACCGIRAARVLIELGGRLVDCHASSDAHGDAGGEEIVTEPAGPPVKRRGRGARRRRREPSLAR
jgi:SAM-dependent methyltransferase